ncbi:MAG: histidine phosphatase family protein [Patescibacteria group bacterium]
MKLILTRHGETEENKRDIIAGWKPGKLSVKGKKQVAAVARKLRGTPIDYILSSDLKRCKDTVVAINKYHRAPVKYLKSLRELGSGVFDGKPGADIQKALDEYKGSREAYKPEGGESMIAFRRRVLAFKKSLAKQKKRYEGKIILICSHSTWAKTFLGLKSPALPAVYLDPKI